MQLLLLNVSFIPLNSKNNTLIKKPNYVRLKSGPIKPPWTKKTPRIVKKVFYLFQSFIVCRI